MAADEIAGAALAELEYALAATPGSRQADIARRITELFLSNSKDYSDQQVEVFGRVLEGLVAKMETQVLAEMSERLGTAARTPVRLVQWLARQDEIAVARPVLTKGILTDEDLIELGETKSQAHLLAISERNAISEPVTDVLVRRGDREVAISVASNLGARFSATGFEMLSSRAKSDDLLAEKVSLRADVPPHLFGQLLVQASNAVRCRMLAAAPLSIHDDLSALLERVAGELADEAPLARDYALATRRVLLTFPDGQIGETDLLRLALGKQCEDVVAALSVMSGISVRVMDQLMSDDRVDPVQFLCRALRFGWPSVRAVLQLGPGKRLSPEDLAAARRGYEAIPDSAAQRMLSFWRQRDAIAA
jgi:uncharacterized protein (DUF2336 family)